MSASHVRFLSRAERRLMTGMPRSAREQAGLNITGPSSYDATFAASNMTGATDGGADAQGCGAAAQGASTAAPLADASAPQNCVGFCCVDKVSSLVSPTSLPASSCSTFCGALIDLALPQCARRSSYWVDM